MILQIVFREKKKKKREKSGRRRDMEDEIKPAISPCWWDSLRSPARQSAWLEATLSDLDQRTKAIISLIEEEENSSAQRGEISYQKRSQLVKMVEELHSSFRAVAVKFDQTRAEPTTAFPHLSSSSSSNSLKQLMDAEAAIDEAERSGAPNSNPESVVEDPETEIVIAGKQNPGGEGRAIKERFKIAEKINEAELRDLVWKDLGTHAALLEDLMTQQEELIRRNDEKRRSIKELHLQFDRLYEENRVLQNCVFRSSMRRNPSRLKRLLSWKIW
ncbi:hypothetical protein H6P81_020378 [Aristolochia fimbriata]|uniref:NAB domain-containing protein n=1 Tax=Aristolochia fimbriata TaxID=158543 RepID=A0AAV7DUD9_ARIFI|nr:hypothetical protein H6P81_020378 [Aristolochia fimbriata]